MITRTTLRRAVAVPAALTLALGGALFGATAANAAPADLVISTPVAGSTTDSREVVVSGTVQAGTRVDVYEGTAVQGTAAAQVYTGNSTTWSTTLTYDETDAVDQSITVSGLVGFAGVDPQTIAFKLPAVQTFSVTAPTAGQQLDSRDVTFTGTGNDGSTVNVLDTTGERLVGPAVVQDGTWTLDYTYDELADREQTVRVTQVTGGAGTGDETITFNLTTGQTLVVATPAEGSTTETRAVEFSGTGNAGSTVNLLDVDGNRLAPVVIIDDEGNWSTVVEYADDAPVAQTVRVTQVTGASGSGDITRTFNLAAAEVVPVPTEPLVIDTPVITAPVNGEVVVGDRVTFQGTGTPGSDISVIAVPTAELEQLQAELDAAAAQGQPSTLAQPNPQPEPVDPAERIVVGEDGTWSVTVATVPGDYTAVAVSALLNEDGTAFIDPATGLPVVAGPSNEVEFSVVAAVVPADSGATPVVPAASGLAYTGSDASGLALGLAGALTLAGVALTLTARRRRALATVGTSGE